MENNSKKNVINNSGKTSVMEKNIKKDKGVRTPKDIKIRSLTFF